MGQGFLDLLAKDGIALGSTNQYGNALVQTQKNNIAPRFGFAYQATPKLVLRGGLGLFYNAFENQGYGPNIGENYPFVYNFNFQTNGSDSAPFGAGPNPYSTCPTAGVGGSAPIGTGLTCAAFTPLAVNATGLGTAGTSVRLSNASYIEHESHSPICVDEHVDRASGVRLHRRQQPPDRRAWQQ